MENTDSDGWFGRGLTENGARHVAVHEVEDRYAPPPRDGQECRPSPARVQP